MKNNSKNIRSIQPGTKTTIGDKVAMARLNILNMSQTEFAKLVKINPVYISRIEANKIVHPTVFFVAAIAFALDCTVDTLLDDDKFEAWYSEKRDEADRARLSGSSTTIKNH